MTLDRAGIRVCGGLPGPDFNYVTAECFLLNNDFKTWKRSPSIQPMKVKRIDAARAQMGNRWWATGGRNIDGITATTEFMDESGSWEMGFDLPAKTFGHCMVNIDKDHVFMTGGYHLESSAFRSSYIFQEGSNSPRQVENMLYPRFAHSCAILENKNVIVAGGFNSTRFMHKNTEIFSFETGRWTEGPDLPYGKQNGAVMTTIDGITYHIGGHPPATNIFRLDKDVNEKWKWTPAAQLKYHKWFFDAVPIHLTTDDCKILN